MKILKPTLLLLLLSLPIYLHAQQRQVQMDYDKAGNRTHLQTVLLSSESNPRQNQSRTRSTGNDTREYANDWIGTHEVRIYPNPTKGALRVALVGTEPDKPILLRLYTENGSLLIQQNWNGEETVLDLSGYSSGIYLLSVYLDGINKKFKVIKE